MSQLKAYFTAIGRYNSAGKQGTPPEFPWDEYFSTLEVGQIVFANTRAVVPDYPIGKGAIRRHLVYGLWRDDGGKVQKIETISFTTNMSMHASDLVIDTSRLKKKFRAKTATKLTTGTIHIFDIRPDHVALPFSMPITISKSIWPEILVRRANSLLFSPERQHNMLESDFTGLTREGFVFGTIGDQNLCDPRLAFDTNASPIQRKPVSILEQSYIDRIASFAVAYREKAPFGKKHLIYPPLSEWPSDIPSVPLPVWKRDERDVWGFYNKSSASLKPDLP